MTNLNLHMYFASESRKGLVPKTAQNPPIADSSPLIANTYGATHRKSTKELGEGKMTMDKGKGKAIDKGKGKAVEPDFF